MTGHEHDTPAELRDVEARLEDLGRAERRHGAQFADKVAMRTAHLLRHQDAHAAPVAGRLRAALLWIAAPAGMAIAMLIVLAILHPGPAGKQPVAGVEVLAANVGRDIDAWIELDAMWRQDAIEADLAVLSLEAADVAAQSDDLSPLPALEAGSSGGAN